MPDHARDRDLDLFRSRAVFLVVLLHAWGAASQYAIPGSWELRTWTFLAAHCTGAAMPALFLISGYLLFQNYSPAAWPARMFRRVKRLMVPYVCWNVVFVLFYLACGQIFPRVSARVASFGLTTWSGCLAAIIHPFSKPIDFPVWYMRTIFVFAFTSPALWLLMRNRLGRWICLGAAFAYFAVCKVRFLPDSSAYPSYAILCLITGSLLATVKKPIADFFHSPWWIAPGALALGLFACPLFGISSPLDYGCCSLLLTPLFFRLSSTSTLDFDSFNQPLFFLYTGHFLFCSVWVHALAPLMTSFETGKLTALIGLFLVPGIATLFGVYRFAKRLFPRAIRLFDGSL